MNTGPRRICGIKNKQYYIPNIISHGKIEMDSHADTAVCGSNFVVLDYTSQECDVTPYNSKDIEKYVPITTCYAIAWDDYSSVTYIITIQQALYMGYRGIDHSLINPIQLITHGVEIQDDPFSVTQYHIDTGFDSAIIPLFIQGSVVFTNTMTPTEDELQSCPKIAIKSSKLWNPYDMTSPRPLQ